MEIKIVNSVARTVISAPAEPIPHRVLTRYQIKMLQSYVTSDFSLDHIPYEEFAATYYTQNK